MTQTELTQFFGLRSPDVINSAFIKAEKECETIKLKRGTKKKGQAPDYTIEETLIALRCADKMRFTPMMERILIEGFIHRDSPLYYTPKKIKMSQQAKKALYYNKIHRFASCSNCRYVEARQFKKISKEHPFCTFYGIFLNKIKPTVNIYTDRCNSWKGDKNYFWVFTENGVYKSTDINYDGTVTEKTSKDFLGISQSSFKSKRKQNEPIIILKDAFTLEDYGNDELNIPED